MPAPATTTGPDADARNAQWIAHFQGDVWRYLRHLGCDRTEADDLTQDTFVVLLRTPTFDDRAPAATAAWLRRIAENRFRNHLRKVRRREDPRWIAAVNQVWTVDDVPTDHRLEALATCLDGLEDGSRALVDAFYRDGESRRAIADRLGMQESGIKTRLQRLRAALRRCVESRLAREEQSR